MTKALKVEESSLLHLCQHELNCLSVVCGRLVIPLALEKGYRGIPAEIRLARRRESDAVLIQTPKWECQLRVRQMKSVLDTALLRALGLNIH